MMVYCPSCLNQGVRTPVERYRKQALRYCTFHYWLMRGRGDPVVYTLKDYSEVSARHGFKISLPSDEDRRIMLEADHDNASS